MFIRTYLRTLFNDIFKNNFVVKSFVKIVNFYCNLWFKGEKTIKFEPNIPIRELERKSTISFQSVTGDQIDCK